MLFFESVLFQKYSNCIKILEYPLSRFYLEIFIITTHDYHFLFVMW